MTDTGLPGQLTPSVTDDSREDPLVAQLYREQHYQQLLDHCPLMIAVHESGRLVYVNTAAVQQLGGTSKGQFIGRPITEFAHPDTIPAMMARIASLRHAGDTSGPAEEKVLRLDGTTLDVEVISVLTMWQGKLAYQIILRDLSAQKAAEGLLRYQAALVDHVSDAIIATTATGIVTSWNPAAEAIYRRPATQALALPVSEVVGAPLDPVALVASGGLLHTTHRTPDGATLSVRVSATAMDNGFVLVCTDQTALLQAEQHFQTVVASLVEGVVVLGNDGCVESVNPAALQILGIDSSDLVYDATKRAALIPIYDAEGRVVNPDQRALSQLLQARAMQTGCIFGVDRPGDGKRIWLSTNSRLLNPDNPQGSSVLISFIDITAQHVASRRFAHEATHDALTGLPNRVQVLSHLTQHLEQGHLTRPGAVLFIDLDSFKTVNDSLGHEAGDTMLKAAAHRIKAALRADDVIGRLGGDEFVAVIQGAITRAELDEVAQRIHTILAAPIRIAEVELGIRASIGIAAISEDDPREPSHIVRDADAAMYEAKTSRQQTSYSTPELRPGSLRSNTNSSEWGLSP